jgi:hypothetical protein
MIDESQLSYQRGTLVEFTLRLGGGPKTCRGFVLNTAVCAGKGARQVWILDMDDPTPALEAQWTRRKYIVPENDIRCSIPRTFIGQETLLRDNPICYPVSHGLHGDSEIPAVQVTVPFPVAPSPQNNQMGAKDSKEPTA